VPAHMVLLLVQASHLICVANQSTHSVIQQLPCELLSIGVLLLWLFWLP
jgi:hypothetical protein